MLQKESNHKGVRISGCCFLCACYLGGLNDIDEADDCFDWATRNEKVRANDSYKRNLRSGIIVKGNNHFYVTDQNGNEIFNSVKPNYGH